MIEMNLAVGVTSRYVTIVVDDVHVVLSFSFNIYGYEHDPCLPSVPLRSGSPHDVINICLVIYRGRESIQHCFTWSKLTEFKDCIILQILQYKSIHVRHVA